MYLYYKSNNISKIDVYDIVKNHLDTFRRYGEDKLRAGDLVFFFLFPFILSILFAIKYKFTETTGMYTITGFSIFTGLLLYLLVLILDFSSKTKAGLESKLQLGIYNSLNKENKLGFSDFERKGNKAILIDLINETYANISFSILNSLIIVALSLSFVFTITNSTVVYFQNVLMFFLIINFLTTLLMVLKRINSIIEEIMK